MTNTEQLQMMIVENDKLVHHLEEVAVKMNISYITLIISIAAQLDVEEQNEMIRVLSEMRA